MIIGLFTEILSNGGVQRASRHVAAVTAKFAGDRDESYRFLSLNDPQGLHTVRVGPSEFLISGHAGDKTQFVFAALRAASRKPSLVVALHPHLAPIVSGMRLRSRKFSSVVFAHGIEVWHPLSWPRGPALRSADLVLGPSQDTVQHLISQQRVRVERTKLLPWGLDPDFEQQVVAASVHSCLPELFPREGRIILTVGRWDSNERYKGADTLIEALPRVQESVPDAFLILVGNGDDRPRLEQLARNHGVHERVRFLSGLTQQELVACFMACHVFALPSRGEGFGLVFLEAMACSKPVIGTAYGGIPDVVKDGVNGLLVPYGDAALLAYGIAPLLANPARAQEMGAHGKENVERTFSFDQFQARLRQVLEDVIGRKQRC